MMRFSLDDFYEKRRSKMKSKIRKRIKSRIKRKSKIQLAVLPLPSRASCS